MGLEAFKAALERLMKLRDEHAFQVVVLHFSQERSPLLDEVRAAGLTVVDLRGPIQDYMRRQEIAVYEQSPLALSEGDPHPSALGHKIAAQALLDVVLRAGAEARAGLDRAPARP